MAKLNFNDVGHRNHEVILERRIVDLSFSQGSHSIKQNIPMIMIIYYLYISIKLNHIDIQYKVNISFIFMIVINKSCLKPQIFDHSFLSPFIKGK